MLTPLGMVYYHIIKLSTRCEILRKKIWYIVGVIMVTINMDNENLDVAKNVIGEYPPSFPYLVLLVDGIVVHYRDEEFIDFMILGNYELYFGFCRDSSLKVFILDFIRRNLPNDLLQILTDVTAKKFLNSWHKDNKVTALIFQPNLPPRLQYSMIAYLHRNTVSFG